MNGSATSPGARHFGLVPEPGASPFFNPLLSDVACPSLNHTSNGSHAWAQLPLREWAAHLMAPLFKKHTRNAAARNARAAKRQTTRHPPHASSAPAKAALGAAPGQVQLSGAAALMQSGLVRPSAVLFTTPPSSWPLAPRLSVLMYHSTWLCSSPAYALVTGCSSSPKIIATSPSLEGQAGLQQQKQSREDSAMATRSTSRSPSLAAWQKQHPVQIGPCDASQRRAVALALQGESFVLRGPPGCGKTNTLAAMVRKYICCFFVDMCSIVYSRKMC